MLVGARQGPETSPPKAGDSYLPAATGVTGSKKRGPGPVLSTADEGPWLGYVATYLWLRAEWLDHLLVIADELIFPTHHRWRTAT